MFKKEDLAEYYGKNNSIKRDKGILYIKFMDDYIEFDKFFLEKFEKYPKVEILDMETARFLVDEALPEQMEDLVISRFNAIKRKHLIYLGKIQEKGRKILQNFTGKPY
jgi:hypothetical protein